MEKNKKRHREEEGKDPWFGSRGRSVSEDTMPRFAKRQTTSAIEAVASSGMFWHDRRVAPELIVVFGSAHSLEL